MLSHGSESFRVMSDVLRLQAARRGQFGGGEVAAPRGQVRAGIAKHIDQLQAHAVGPAQRTHFVAR